MTDRLMRADPKHIERLRRAAHRNDRRRAMQGRMSNAMRWRREWDQEMDQAWSEMMAWLSWEGLA